MGRPAGDPARQLSWFFLTGGAGFVVDNGPLSLEVHLLHIDVYPARAVSFAAAVMVTWLVNRRLAFRGVVNYGGSRYWVFRERPVEGEV